MSNFDPTLDLPSSVPAILMSLVRWAGGMLGGWLLAKGWFTADQLAEVGGGAMALVVAAWAWYSSHRKNEKLKAAIMAPSGMAE